MSANNTRPSHHRDQDAATSAVARVGTPSTQGHSPGIHMHIDAARAFLTLSSTEGAAIIKACCKTGNETGETWMLKRSQPGTAWPGIARSEPQPKDRRRGAGTDLGARNGDARNPARTAASAPGTYLPTMAAVHSQANLTRHAPFGNSFLEVNMLNKRPQPPQPDRIRSIHGSFSWIDHRFLRQGFDQGLTRLEKLFYFLLIAVSNMDGVSFYSDERLWEVLEIRHGHELTGARDELVARDLIAFKDGIYQVLDLPAGPQKY